MAPQWDSELANMLIDASPHDTAWRARLRATSLEALKGAREPETGDSYAHKAVWNEQTTAPLAEIVRRRWPEAARAKGWKPVHSSTMAPMLSCALKNATAAWIKSFSAFS